MDIEDARRIIETLSQGIHPVTGEVMPPDSPYNEPAVIRSLFIVSRALDPNGPHRKPRHDPPAKAGKPWQPEEDEKLRAAHEAGRSAVDIGTELERTPFAIESRLVKLGLLPLRAGMRFPGPGTAQEAPKPYVN